MGVSLELKFNKSRTSSEMNDQKRETNECAHCGEMCVDETLWLSEKAFCCNGCRSVYQILSENDMGRYYKLAETPGLTPSNESGARFDFLDDPKVLSGLLDFEDDEKARITLKIPGIHCLSCVWLLENIYQIQEGVLQARVNYSRATLSLVYIKEKVSLKELVVKLAQLGYEADIRLADMEKDDEEKGTALNRLFLARLTIAGFCFGNIMISSFPSYFGLEVGSGLSDVFAWINLVLVLPVVFFCAKDYWQAAANVFLRRIVTLDFPVFLGMLALFAQSIYEILSGTGEGYCDSLAGLIFFLLCGKAFQRTARNRLLFDRDYKSFFPVWSTVIKEGKESAIILDDIAVGDRLLVRNNQLIPADSILMNGEALVDYSFVTGEAEAQRIMPGAKLSAGGRQCGGSIELEVLATPSRSYLTSLWESKTFAKQKNFSILDLSRKTGGIFTVVVLAIAISSGLYHGFYGDGFSVALRVFVAVAIVACPCALSLSAPFSFGFTNMFLGRKGFYLKNANVLEVLAGVDHIVFDKTGTLSDPSQAGVNFVGDALSADDKVLVHSLARQSVHPLCRHITSSFSDIVHEAASSVEEFAGRGISGQIGKRAVRLGSAAWLKADDSTGQGSVWLEIDGEIKGSFIFEPVYRSGMVAMIGALKNRFKLFLLSGDRDSEKKKLSAFFPDESAMLFEQKPEDKMQKIDSLRREGHKVLMVGDGLNDAGALQGANCGIAVADDLNAFSPACDIILSAKELYQLNNFLDFSRYAMNLIRFNFALSLAYNVVGIYFAVTGELSPLICAILMPLSSVSVLLASGIGAALGNWFLLRQKKTDI